MAKMKLNKEFIVCWLLGCIISFAATFIAYGIGGGGEYQIGTAKDMYIALIHHPLLYLIANILMGLLIGIGTPKHG